MTERKVRYMLTIKRVAEILSVSESTVRRMIADEQVEAIRVRGGLRVFEDSIVGFQGRR